MKDSREKKNQEVWGKTTEANIKLREEKTKIR